MQSENEQLRVTNRVNAEQNIHFRRNQESESLQKEDLQDQVTKLHIIVKQLKLVIQKQKYMETLNNADLRGMMSTNIRVAETIGGLVCFFCPIQTYTV